MLGFATFGVVGMVPSAAVAHAELASSNPPDNASVQTMPTQVSLTLSEPVQKPSRVVVTSPDGTRMNSYDVTVRDDTVTTEINQAAPAGKYTISYEILSSDDHAVAGNITFGVLAGATPSPSPTQPAVALPSNTPVGGAAETSQTAPAADGSTTTQDALTIIGFSVVAMTGLLLVLRAGLKSASSEDED